MRYIQDIIDELFLFEEDAEKIEDGIYMGLMYGLEDPVGIISFTLSTSPTIRRLMLASGLRAIRSLRDMSLR